jgi:prepilin-type N-terminal cleavage/methylation domain-containing protein
MRFPRDDRGFTLAELLVALAMVALVLTAVVMIESGTLQAYVVGSNKSEVQQNARVALERMAREIRQTSAALTVATATSLQFADQDTGVTTYWLNGTALTRTSGGADAVVVGAVQALTFAYRDVNNAVLATPVGTPANVYRVDITIRTASEDAAVVANAVSDARAELTTTVRLRNCVSGVAPCS